MGQLLDIVTIVCVGVMIGTEFAVSAFVDPILAKLDSSARGHATRLFAQKLGSVMPFWYGLSLLLLIAEAVVRRNEAGFVPIVAAGVIWAGVILMSVLLLVPINNRIAKMQGNVMSEQLRQDHKKWDLLHRWRVFLLAVAMLCLCVGLGV